MKFLPPFLHEGAVDVQSVAAETTHCVNQTRSPSVSGDAGAAVLRSAIVIVTRRQAVFAGRQGVALLLGQLTVDERMSRFGMFALVSPSASYVASFAGSVAALFKIASPFGCWPVYTPVPPICRTYIACVPSSALRRLVESAYEICASPLLPIRSWKKSPSVRFVADVLEAPPHWLPMIVWTLPRRTGCSPATTGGLKLTALEWPFSVCVK